MNSKSKKAGFSLVELLMVLAIMNIILVSVLGFLTYFQNIYGKIEAQSDAQGNINTMFVYINKDIRSAASPNSLTDAVKVLSNGQELSIYTFDSTQSKYKMIQYRLNPANKSLLQRGWIYGDATAPVDANPSYGTITDDSNDYSSGTDGKWKTILSSVQYLDASNNNAVLFKDVTSAGGIGRKSIELTISAKDSRANLQTPITMKTEFTSRSRLSN